MALLTWSSKYSVTDPREREHWDDYMEAYEDMIRNTATKHAPWYVVPADKKWFTRLVMTAGIIDALDALNLAFPGVDAEKLKELAAARAVMEGS